MAIRVFGWFYAVTMKHICTSCQSFFSSIMSMFVCSMRAGKTRLWQTSLQTRRTNRVIDGFIDVCSSFEENKARLKWFIGCCSVLFFPLIPPSLCVYLSWLSNTSLSSAVRLRPEREGGNKDGGRKKRCKEEEGVQIAELWKLRHWELSAA